MAAEIKGDSRVNKECNELVSLVKKEQRNRMRWKRERESDTHMETQLWSVAAISSERARKKSIEPIEVTRNRKGEATITSRLKGSMSHPRGISFK